MRIKIPAAVANRAAPHMLKLQTNSPQLLFGAGVVGMVGSTVLACRATLKLEDALLETQKTMEQARTMDHPDYSDKDRQRDLSILYVRGAVQVGKLYAPAIGLGVVSVAALTKSHNILNERNAALAAAYAALDKGFKEYRERVSAKYGEEEDRQFRYGAQEVEIKDEKTGRKKKVTRVADGEPSIYAKFFDPLNKYWSKEADYNRIFLRCQQNWANDMLHARGHVFLNEVYDALGLDRTKAGAVVGWYLSDNSDNYVDFGVFRNDDSVVDFVNGRESSILLDFNVDGVIFDKIEVEEERVSWQKD